MKIFLSNPHLFAYIGLVLVQLLLFVATFFVEKLFVLRKWLVVTLVFTPVIYFYLILEAHVINIPFTDDFNLLETVHNFRNAPDFLTAVKELFAQVNQHRFAFERIVMLIMVFFTGTVNIKTQIILGDLFLLGIFYLLFRAFKKESLPSYYFLPVPYILFNLIYFENAFWGIAAIQNTPLIFFAFLTAYGVGQGNRKGFYLGMAAALLTTFTSGSGLLAWIIGAVILFFQKRYKSMGWWVVAAAAVILFYFLFDYSFVKSEGDKVWEHPVFNFIFLLGFWGNALYMDIRHPLNPQFHADLVWCVLLGAAIGLVFLLWFIRILKSQKLAWNDWFLWGALMFSMGTGAMFVISRPINTYLMLGGNVFSRRYMIFGIALLAAFYVCLIILMKDFRKLNKILVSVSIIFFIALNFTSYYLSIGQVRKFHDDLVIDSYYWKNYKTFLTAGDRFGDIPFWNHPTKMRDLIITLENAGLSDFYQIESLPAHRELIQKTAAANARFEGDLQANFHYRNTDNNIPSKYYSFFASPAQAAPSPSYFVLASGKYTILLPALPVPNAPFEFLKSGSYYSKNVQYSLFKSKLPNGIYQVWMLYPDSASSNQWKSFNTGKTVFIN